MSKGLDMKYFVLGPKSSDEKHAYASICGIIAYAITIYPSNKEMGQSTYDWARDILSERFPEVAIKTLEKLTRDALPGFRV